MSDHALLLARNVPKPTETATAAILHLAAHGYATTTASELADAVGMSRSTFFRRFGSKEDVIFADHNVAIAYLEELLTHTRLELRDAVVTGAIEVVRVLLRDTAAATARFELLKRNPTLRERELIITYRYERIFINYLTRTAQPGTPEWVPTALAAGLVAVHNAALRRWLRDGGSHSLSTLERELEHSLTALADQFSPWYTSPRENESSRENEDSRVIVATFDAAADPDEVMRAVHAHLS